MLEKTRKEKIWQEQALSSRKPININTVLALAAACLLFPFAWLMRPFASLKIGILNYRAMGRFYGNTEYTLRARALNPPPKRELVFLISGNEPVNKQILTMVGRKVKVFRRDWLWKALDYLQKITPVHPIWIDMGCTGWLRGREWSVPGPQLNFTPDEHRRGQELLRRLGIPEGVRHVCFFAKDRFYTDSPDTKLDPNSYWGSRDFRNCHIQNYLAAADYLAKQGIYVLRMGIHKPEELLPDGLDPRIIDYTGIVRPTLDDPDFADTYLQATCKFFLGCTSGIYQLSSIFGIPIAYANVIPYGECGRLPHDIVIFKTCIDIRTGKPIPFQEMIKRGLDEDWLTLEEILMIEEQGIELVENNEEEILALAREMNERLDGAWVSDKEDDILQEKAQMIFTARAFDGSGFPGRIGSEFLRLYKDLL